MLPFPHTPIYYEWVALIDDNPASAKQHLLSLKAQEKIQGLMAHPSVTVSIEEYARAQALLASTPSTAEQTAQIDAPKRIGLAMLASTPDVNEWRKLIADDPVFAKRLYTAFRTKYAMMLSQTSYTVISSIEIYRQLTNLP